MSGPREHDSGKPTRRRPHAVRTAVVLAIVAGLIYAAFIARGVVLGS